MSYDVSIGDFDGNYTSNAGKLFHKHIVLTRTMDQITGLQALDGLQGEEASPILADAWKNINAERRELSRPSSGWKDNGDVGEPEMEKLYNSLNGWGSLVGALVFLGEITAACACNPHERISVSA